MTFWVKEAFLKYSESFGSVWNKHRSS